MLLILFYYFSSGRSLIFLGEEKFVFYFQYDVLNLKLAFLKTMCSTFL